MYDEELTFEEAVEQQMSDGELELNLLPIIEWKITE